MRPSNECIRPFIYLKCFFFWGATIQSQGVEDCSFCRGEIIHFKNTPVLPPPLEIEWWPPYLLFFVYLKKILLKHIYTEWKF